jgi:hypothetical protein
MGSHKREEPRFGRGSAAAQLLIAVGAGVAAGITAPTLGDTDTHREFIDFFATSAAVISALLIVLAIEARSVFPLKGYALITPACLAVGEVSAIAALSPSLPGWSYGWFLGSTVGGGLAGLVAVIWAAKKLLEKDVQTHRVDELIAAGARSLEEKERRAKAAAGGGSSGRGR